MGVASDMVNWQGRLEALPIRAWVYKIFFEFNDLLVYVNRGGGGRGRPKQ
jgi:hypothetical protein